MLLRFAAALAEVDAELSATFTREKIRAVVEQVPEGWLGGPNTFGSAAAMRESYVNHLWQRLQPPPFDEGG